MKKFLSWIERVSEFKSLMSVLWYVVLLTAFLTGLALIATALMSPASIGSALALAVIGAALVFPYCWGLMWRIDEFNAAKASWLALVGGLV